MPTGGGGGGSGAAIGVAGFGTFITTAGTNASLANSANTLKLYGLPLPYPFKISNLAIRVTVADAVNNSDVGLYNSAGTLVAHIGAQTLPSTGVLPFALVGAPLTLPGGLYYFAATSVGLTASVEAYNSGITVSTNVNFGSSSGGALPASISPPAASPTIGQLPGFIFY